MDGIQQQIKSNITSDLTLDDISNAFDLIFNQNISDKPIVLLTNIGGLLQFNFSLFGRAKLPRKMKKRIYFTYKLRKQYLPKYYKNYVNSKRK